ncbi:MAG: exodeoxyribonuclease VII large subunit [Deltaproteobacteria bacterium]|nr:exodeoxyribonuclease VII large subunit [Deltaproteobacteria bacterium]
MEKILTVTELTANIKVLLETSFGILWVAGEVSNLRRPASGHSYFTLKDADSQIRAVLFRQSALSVGFGIEDGMEVVCRGRLSLYHPRGEYQIVVDAIEPRGLGALQKAFEQLKEKLAKEGLFEAARKRPIPFLPRQIGVVTSPSGAAIRDILTITGRRFPSIDVLIAPVRVQGREAAPEIVEGLRLLNRVDDVDVIILARGGGSLEDLHPFNDERVARAIVSLRIPVISAVGHEIDFTIADFAADLRAPTPSAAAELAVPNSKELAERLESMKRRVCIGERRIRERALESMRDARTRMRDPRRTIEDLRLETDDYSGRLTVAWTRSIALRQDIMQRETAGLFRLRPLLRIAELRNRLEGQKGMLKQATAFFYASLRKHLALKAAVLDNLSPLAVLRRGYGIVTRAPGGAVVTDARTLEQEESVSVKLARGSFGARVMRIYKE